MFSYSRIEVTDIVPDIHVKRAALDHLLSHPLVKRKQDEQPKIILYGISLGGAVALDLASRNAESILALIIENTFKSIPRMISEIFPSQSSARVIRFVCREKWDNETAIAGLPPDLPLLMLSGLQDEVIPASHMKGLWTIFQQKSPTQAVWQEFPLGKHNNLCENIEYAQSIFAFLTKYVPNVVEEES
ncbi:hypothetical protein Clacol_010078 [Clathrus columnatus]|uniref:Uncharacterized protein n=1 Tax=Clathrus columnatus TaxID=1419009 RepID=A0AAV5AST3_9AGAM|nr:hypothetical protein Clacol_010078 [Clathrus columnatus]